MTNFIKLVILAFLFASLTAHAQQQKEVVLFWDTSLSMQGRDLRTELDFLEDYFSRQDSVRVHFTAFSNDINQEQDFYIGNGNWEELKQELQNTVYDGGTRYETLDFSQSADAFLLATDGIETFTELPTKASAPVYVIYTGNDKNTSSLERLALVTGGRFNDLYTATTKSNGQNARNIIGVVSGKVGDSIGPIAGVNVRLVNTDKGTVTDDEGNFEIKADRGAVLEFSFVGKALRRVRVGDSNYLAVNMDYLDDNLDEVIVTTTIASEGEIEDTGLGTVEKKKLGYAVQSIGEEDISAVDTDVTQAVSGQFSGVLINPGDDLSQFLSRGVGQTILGNQYGLIVVDGTPREISVSGLGGSVVDFSYIDPQNIAKITVLKGLAATNRWGTLGRNGVIMITTKTFSDRGAPDNRKSKKIGTTDTYAGGALELNALPNTSYINALRISKDVNEAYTTYLKQRAVHGNRPEFFIDVATYFEGWENEYLLKKILSNTAELNADNIEILRALAYKYQELGDYQQAVAIYGHILELAPDQAQSYRDLALAHDYAGNFTKAMEIYNRIVNTRNIGKAIFQGLRQTIDSEYKNLVAQHEGQLNAVNIDPRFKKKNELDRRIVFEWNNLNAGFDLQIVNPQQRYFTWSHTQKGEPQRLAQEKQQGYGLEEYFLTAGDKGTWLFNMINYGLESNDDGSPIFVKITVYTDYGKPNQTKEIKTVRLSEIDKVQTVMKLTI